MPDTPHPHDPDGNGYHGTKADAEDAAAYVRRTGAGRDATVTHPSNALPGHPALTNVGTIYDTELARLTARREQLEGMCRDNGIEVPTDGELTDDQLVLIMTKFPATIAQFDPDVVDRVRDRLPQEVAA